MDYTVLDFSTFRSFPGKSLYTWRCDVRSWQPNRRDWIKCGATGWTASRNTALDTAIIHMAEHRGE